MITLFSFVKQNLSENYFGMEDRCSTRQDCFRKDVPTYRDQQHCESATLRMSLPPLGPWRRWAAWEGLGGGRRNTDTILTQYRRDTAAWGGGGARVMKAGAGARPARRKQPERPDRSVESGVAEGRSGRAGGGAGRAVDLLQQAANMLRRLEHMLALYSAGSRAAAFVARGSPASLLASPLAQ